jgi:DNA (cytosine-5)-methyltransferase 1
MTNEPIILDLFCGAGGAGEGYYRAGFTVIGVDIDPHEYPPGRFYCDDALKVLEEVAISGTVDGILIDAVHLSPPCQRWATGTADPEAHPDFITPARPLLERWGGPYVIENVPGAPLVDPVMLCGSSFHWDGQSLGVRRHRHFETNFPLERRPNCQHAAQGTPVGVYGDHPDTREYFRPDGSRRGAKATSLEAGQRAMGIDWMVWEDLKEAIPPAYTKWIGWQLKDLLAVAA